MIEFGSNMQVRSISVSELERFVASGPHSLCSQGFAQYIRELWERGSSQPDRCFIVEAEGRIIGRILYRGQNDEIDFTGLHLPWDQDYLSIGHHLFRDSLLHLQQDGIKILEAFVSSAWEYRQQAQNLIESLGLTLVQTKMRYVWRQMGKPSVQSSRLVYRTLTEIGDEVFIDIIRRASLETLDRLDQLQINSIGAEQHARSYFRLLKTEFEHFPDWWLAAYTTADEVVGHVVAVPYNLHRHEGSIGYIGVVPEQRGKGYVDELLRQGMAVMVQDGISTVICDTDEPNLPMRHAFDRCGYSPTDTTWVYRGVLDHVLSSSMKFSKDDKRSSPGGRL